MANKQKSLLLFTKQGKFEVQDTDIPTPGSGELLVQIYATALNPADWKVHDDPGDWYKPNPGVLGTDSAGVVAAVGEGVTEFSVGDKVLHQGFFENRKATFQQYTIVPADIVAKIPQNLSFDQAATVPLALGTAVCGLYNVKLPWVGGAQLVAPWEEGGRGKYAGQPILIIGGSSSVGQTTIQCAKLSGFSPIITTASARNESFLKTLGATHVLDRKSVPLSSLASAINEITSEPIKIVYDAISEPDTQNAAYDIVASGGKLILVLPCAIEESRLTEDKELVNVVGNVHMPQLHAVGVMVYKHLTEYLASGDIKPNNVEIVPNGLHGIPDGLKKLKAGVSAVKLVAHPQETV